MIVVYPFSVADQELAFKNSQWMNELYGCKGHEVLMIYDKRCYSGTVDAVGIELSKAFDRVYPFPAGAEIDGWPDGANYFFRVATSRLESKPQTKFFMWMEPDAIPLCEGWLEMLHNEYIFVAQKMGKPFMGDRVQVENIPLHMSGIGFYPLPLHAYAGEAYRAHDTAWDMAGKDQIVPKAHFTKLIEHAWRHPTFTVESELETQIRKEAVVFHSSKDGSLIDLLRSKRGRKHSDAHPLGEQKASAHLKEPEEPGSPSPIPPRDDPARGPQPVCDIFIRTYEPDYKWLEHCLRSIDKFCVGFRKVMIVSPHNPPVWMLNRKSSIPVEWKVMNDECEDGYLAQQITKMYADVILDYQPDFILHVDSDVIFTTEVAPRDFLHNDQVIWFYTPYNKIQTPWQPITEKFFGHPVENEFMRRFPIMVPRWIYPRVREFCHKRHGVTLGEYIKQQPLRSFSEFNVLGAYAFKSHQDKFAFENTESWPTMPAPIARQFHSWGGLTKEVVAEIATIFGEVADHPAPTAGAGTAPGEGRSLPPPGIKELPSGIWVVDGDSHIGKWVEQEQRLDHDQNTLPDILPLIKEGDIVVDGGANIGDHTIAYLKKVGSTGTVHAFEPHPLLMECLKHNLPKNYSLCTYQVALGDKDRMVKIVSDENYGAAHVFPGGDIKMMPLDFFNLPRVDLIKLDVEGSEVRALMGAHNTIERCHPVLVIEVNEVALARQQVTVGQLYALLENHGYQWKIVQENACESDPMFDIICSYNPKSPEATFTGNGEGNLPSRCVPSPPPVTSFHQAISILKEHAANTKGRWEVMMALYNAGLTPRNKNKKKKRHEPTDPDTAKTKTSVVSTPQPESKPTGRISGKRTKKLVSSEGKID